MNYKYYNQVEPLMLLTKEDRANKGELKNYENYTSCSGKLANYMCQDHTICYEENGRRKVALFRTF